MGPTLLSYALDVGVALAVAVGLARVGRTLLSDAFDVVLGLVFNSDLKIHPLHPSMPAKLSP